MYAEDKKRTQIHTQTLHPLRNDFGVSSPFTQVVVQLCILLGTTLELSSAFPWERLQSFFTFHLGGILALHPHRDDFGASSYFFTLDGVISDVTFYMWGNLALVLHRAAQEKNENYNLWPRLKLFFPSERKRVHKEKIRKLHSLHIISLKLICIPRSWNVIAIHVFQPI